MTSKRKHLAPRQSRETFTPQPTFRPEIQGLRSLAVLLVVTYHIWFGRVSGGVDVFLFISAFLLSLSTLRKIHAGKPLNILKYWLHVFQRLLPAALTVILATTLASYYIIAPSRWPSLLADAKAALFYHLNWHLANNSVDYYAQNATVKTPYQHFWSLSLQGQIFILWPILFSIVALIVWNLRTKVTATALLIFGSIFVASLTFSIKETYTNQAYAYFDTRTRLWEFAAGTLLAILLLKWQAPHKARIIMGWTGIIGLITCGWILPVATGFPGYLALWPILSGALVIAAGSTGSPLGADRLLSTKPLQKLGAISYCLYLVHWPILILYTTATRQEQAGWLDGTLIIAASLALAWLLHTLVEKPLRALETKPTRGTLTRIATSKTPWKGSTPHPLIRPIATLAILLTIGAAPLSAAQAWVNHRESKLIELAETAGSPDFPGATALGTPENRYRYQPIPAVDPYSQYEGAYRPCEDTYATKNPKLNRYCYYEAYGDAQADLTMIIGASHAGQAVAFWREIARTTNTNFKDLHLGSCRFPNEPNPSAECTYLNNNITREILTTKPDNLLIPVSVADPVTGEESLIPGIEEAIKTFTAAGINVIALRDNPRYTYNVYECAQANPDNPALCSAPVTDKLSDQDPAATIIATNPRVYGIDLTTTYCPDEICQPIIGNIYVYMDDNHISRAFGKTTHQEVFRQLSDQDHPLTTS